MENIELKFYWYPNNDTNGVNFQMNKEYVFSEIKEKLSKKNSNKINGFFIHFGIPIADNKFNRIIIERGTENIFKVKEQLFLKNNYINDHHISYITELDFKSIVDHLEIISKNGRTNVIKGISMLKRFGALGSE